MKTDRSVTFVEIDIPYCALRYGEGACTAILGTDSEIKCFNTFETCAKREDFSESTVTLRFAMDAAYLHEAGIEAIPSVQNVTYDPARVSLGEKSLGARAKLSVTFRDHPHGDTGAGFDKYRAERPYDPVRTGSFWGKFRARHPILNGRPIRLIRGVVGQALADMETRHLFIDGFETAEDGRVTIIGKDALKLADGDRAMAPRASTGYLIGNIAAGATTATLGPAGVGDKEYPASGFIALGGSEIVSFTRVGDVLTLVRAQFSTTAQAHQAQDRAQLCLYFLGQNPADILRTLAVDYATIPSTQIPIDDWRAETNAYLRRVYTALIAEPTPVRDLMSELVEQAALALIPDDITQEIRLQVLRAIPTSAGRWSEENIVEGSLRIREAPEKRITQCVTYFGLINPLEDVEDAKNYRSIEALDVTDFQMEKQPRIKRIYSRWIPAGGRTIASRLNELLIARYRDAPRRFDFDVFHTAQLTFGQGYRLAWWVLQLATGERDNVPAQAVAIRSAADYRHVELEELRLVQQAEPDLNNRVIIIDANDFNINLRAFHDALFPPLVVGDTVTFEIQTGVVIGSMSTALPAVDVGEWPEWLVPLIKDRGRMQGHAGDGGRGGNPTSRGGDGGHGGTALYTRHPIVLDLSNTAQLWAGAGGGGGGGGGRRGSGSNDGRGGGGGGGGAGTQPGNGGSGFDGGRGGDAGYDLGGGNGGAGRDDSGAGGRGGNPGENGGRGEGTSAASGGQGGSAGAAIDGNSFVTRTGTGDVRGYLVN